jgi:alpha-tubulin suppressor-like RCC1 family protein
MRRYLCAAMLAWLPSFVVVSAVAQTLSSDINQSFALRRGGGVWTAGANSNTAYDPQFFRTLDPLHIPQTERYKAISTGSLHTIALDMNGTVRVWGLEFSGQFGNGTNVGSSGIPLLVPGLSNIIAISANQNYSLALRADGTVWAWGDCLTGELGNGVSGPFCEGDVPTQVLGLPHIIAIAAGGYHALALAEDGSVYAWGNNQFGQLGDGTTNPGQFGDPPVPNDRSIAAIVPGLANVIAISAGNYFSIALTQDGTVLAWGSNNSGQLGDGTTTDRLVPTATLMTDAVSISAHAAHALSLKLDGTVWSWGQGFAGQLGNGTNENSSVPAAIPGLSAIAEVCAGGTMSMARDGYGRVWTWGSNSFSGQLGDGTATDSNVPIVSKF